MKTRLGPVLTILVLGAALPPAHADGADQATPAHLVVESNTWTKLNPRVISASGETLTKMPWNAYSGLVYNPDIVGIMMWGGGGHGGRRGNDVWIYDIQANEWRQQYDPDPQSEYPYTVNDSGMTFNEYCNSDDPLVCNPDAIWLPRGSTRTKRPWTSHSYDQLAYDAYNRRFVIRGPNFAFGYSLEHYYGVPDAYAYDVGTKQWSKMSTFPNLGAQAGSMEYDPVSRKIVTVGKSWAKPGFGYLGTPQTWVFDAVQGVWSVASSPPPLTFHGANLVYDSVNQCMLIYGGDYPAKSDLWRYTHQNDTWTKLTPLPDPAYGYPPGGAPFGAFDSKNGILLIWGEGDTGDFIPTWAYNVRTNQWKKMNPAGGEPATSANVGANMVYSPVYDLFFLFLNDGSLWTYRYSTTVSNDGVPPSSTGDLRVGSNPSSGAPIALTR